jgi:2'-5' RNA ligase
VAASDEFKRLYQHGTLVIWPPDGLRAEVNALRQRYDPASQAICDAHITLTQPFQVEPTSADLVNVEAVVSQHLPLDLRCGPLATFLPYPCVYLDIGPDEPLRALQADLYALGLFNRSLPHSDPDEYIFHMSITDGYPDSAQTALIRDALSGSEPSGRFRVNSVAWIKPDSRFRFETVRELRTKL